MADEEQTIPISRVNPVTFNNYVNNYFSNFFAQFLAGLPAEDLKSIFSMLTPAIPSFRYSKNLNFDLNQANQNPYNTPLFITIVEENQHATQWGAIVALVDSINSLGEGCVQAGEVSIPPVFKRATLSFIVPGGWWFRIDIQGDTMVKVGGSVSLNAYIITFISNGDGAVGVDGGDSPEYEAGTYLHILITPAEGSHIVDVLVNGISQGIITEYDILAINTDYIIEATFEAD